MSGYLRYAVCFSLRYKIVIKIVVSTMLSIIIGISESDNSGVNLVSKSISPLLRVSSHMDVNVMALLNA